jgi:glycerate kinase
MKFVIAPDSFKESMTAVEAAEAMKSAVVRVIPDAKIALLPLGDGGEGTMEALVSALGGRILEVNVTGPLGNLIVAKFALLNDGSTAVVEMAQASGLQLVPTQERNPLHTTTFGTGELILAALDHGIKRLIVTIGGSATNDAGVGMLQALGAVITDREGKPIGFGGDSLIGAVHVDLTDLDPRLGLVEIQVACDVTNPLVGLMGASRVFAPQKGASPEMIERLEENVKHFADVIQSQNGLSLHDVPGAGAAGGTGAALIMCGGKLMSGIDIVLDVLEFERALSGANYVLTGEGRIDEQTPGGKVIAGVVR